MERIRDEKINKKSIWVSQNNLKMAIKKTKQPNKKYIHVLQNNRYNK